MSEGDASGSAEAALASSSTMIRASPSRVDGGRGHMKCARKIGIHQRRREGDGCLDGSVELLWRMGRRRASVHSWSDAKSEKKHADSIWSKSGAA